MLLYVERKLLQIAFFLKKLLDGNWNVGIK